MSNLLHCTPGKSALFSVLLCLTAQRNFSRKELSLPVLVIVVHSAAGSALFHEKKYAVSTAYFFLKIFSEKAQKLSGCLSSASVPPAFSNPSGSK